MFYLCGDGQPSTRYAEEILDHAGLTWRRLGTALPLPTDAQVVLLLGQPVLPAAIRQALAAFVQRGGALIAVGDTFGFDDLLGAVRTGTLAEGYLAALPDHPLTRGLTSALHVFGGACLQASGAQALGEVLDAARRESIGPAILLHRPGLGLAITVAPDLPGSVRWIQQGSPVHADGVPAPDGTAPIDEGVLKTDDGVVLSWIHDRERTPLTEPIPDCPGKHPAYPDGDTPWFAQPIADELRTLLLRTVLWAAAQVGASVAQLWYWPDALPAVSLISHDSDLNIDASARRTLEVLAEADIRSTWCIQFGPLWQDVFTPETYALVKAAGHEIALHYNALPEDGGAWGEEHLQAQLAWLRREAGVERCLSNKNHYLRWEGDVDFFRWLERAGVQSDQSKGPSKKGNVGYPHGSCQPWFPYDPSQDRFLDVLEIPLQTQDLWLTAPYAIVGPILDQAVRHHGIAHFLFHQAHIYRRPEVADALKRVVADARERGLAWWTCAEINAWERARRQVRVTAQVMAPGRWRLQAESALPLPGAGLVLLLPDAAPATSACTAVSAATGQRLPVRTWTCHGLPALHINCDLPAGITIVEVTLP